MLLRYAQDKAQNDMMNGIHAMKRILFLTLLSGILILSACGGNPPLTQLTSVPVLDTTTSSSFPTSTQTSIPSTTPTASFTSLPTIPIFTPTFDVSTILSVTPAPQAECPKEDAALKLDFRFDDYSIDINQEILKFLHNGGVIRVVTDEMSKIYNQNSYRLADITNDGIPDLIFDGFTQLYDYFYILWCQDGQYSVYSSEEAMGVSIGNRIYEIVDMNKNGVPEIVAYYRSGTGSGIYHFFVGEWNGKTFINLAPERYIEGLDQLLIEDINEDGTLELILIGGFYIYGRTAPWRLSNHTYMWNGKVFTEQPIEYLQPDYRFQAVQDADYAIIIGKHNRAMRLYQEVISNQKLEWWSVERRKYEQAIIDAPWFHEPTPSVKPQEDLTEHPRLAAYAYYRIMLIHLVQNHESEATTTYNTLQEKFGNDPYSHPYVEMASAFWEAYQSTKRMYDGCAAAIQYAVEHPEILTPLGSDYHGWQSHTYVPADVCPFR